MVTHLHEVTTLGSDHSLSKALGEILVRTFPRAKRGRPRHDLHLVVLAILYRLRTGCPWRAVPRIFGAPSTIHGWFQKFNSTGVWTRLWHFLARMVSPSSGGVRGPCYLDASLITAPLGGDGTGPSPVHRGRLGTKRSLLTDADGLPLALIVGPANRHDSKLLSSTLAAAVLPIAGNTIVADRGYRGSSARSAAAAAGLKLVIPESERRSSLRCRFAFRRAAVRARDRWKIERSFAWMNALRGLATRYERKAVNYLGMTHLWAAICWGRRVSGKFTSRIYTGLDEGVSTASCASEHRPVWI